MKPYLDLLGLILEEGSLSDNRTSTKTISSFGHTMKFDLVPFPLITTKKVFFKGVVHELLWFLQGDQNIDYLKKNNIKIWNAWAHENKVGPMYGYQWNRNNQLEEVIENIKKNPNSRRHVVSAWNIDDLPNETLSPEENVKNGKMTLAPCHILFQFNVRDTFLDIAVYQRSMDMFLGSPFNIASYALLTHMIAQQCSLTPSKMTYFVGDAHIYVNHLDQIKEQLKREPRELPFLRLNKRNSIFEYEYSDILLEGYNPHGELKGKISI